MKNINVAGAAFLRDGKLFAARRGYGSQYVIHKYEFAGGKIQEGETPEQAIIRECREELCVDISIICPLGTTVYEYPDSKVTLTVFICRTEEEFTITEYEKTCWLSADEINPEDWAAADRQLVLKIKKQLKSEFTLITGATGVLGGEFCRQCASRGENLYLTGRSYDKLKNLQCTMSDIFPEISVIFCPCELSDEHSRACLFEDGKNYKFSRLVNCAGADIQKPFTEYDEKKIIFQSRSLYEGAVSFSRFCIGQKAEKLSIINISSVSGLNPMPYFAVYSSLKGALTSFSVALAREMKGKNVSVTAILPGAIHTRPDVEEYIKTQGLWGKIASKNPDFVVKKSLEAADKGKVKYVVGFANRLLNNIVKIVPLKLRIKFIAAKWSQTSKDAFTDI